MRVKGKKGKIYVESWLVGCGVEVLEDNRRGGEGMFFSACPAYIGGTQDPSTIFRSYGARRKGDFLLLNQRKTN